MYNKLIENKEKSYSPYSNYKVSSCVVTKDGREFFGVNIENASLGGTVCAEKVAILKAISEGVKKGEFKEIHILGDTLAYPCFICRQTFVEFFDKDVKIYIYDEQGNNKEYLLDEICPFPFEGELK